MISLKENTLKGPYLTSCFLGKKQLDFPGKAEN
jgi:hypothetical protein